MGPMMYCIVWIVMDCIALVYSTSPMQLNFPAPRGLHL